MALVAQGTPVLYMDRAFRNWWIVARFSRDCEVPPEGMHLMEPMSAPVRWLAPDPDVDPTPIRALRLGLSFVDISDMQGVVRRWQTILIGDAWQLEALARILAARGHSVPLELV